MPQPTHTRRQSRRIRAPAGAGAGAIPLVSRWRWLAPAGRQYRALFVVAQIVFIVCGLIFPDDFRYVSATNVSLVLKAIPVLGIIALGVGVLMISGEFDLSVGAVYTVTAYAMALLYLNGVPLALAVALTLLIGAAIGVVNGLITVKMAIPSFITTLGSMLVVRGFVRWISEGRSVSFHPTETFVEIVTGSLLGVDAEFLWFLGLTIAVGIILHRTKLGNHMFSSAVARRRRRGRRERIAGEGYRLRVLFASAPRSPAFSALPGSAASPRRRASASNSRRSRSA